ncbi:cAMP-dependent protein kinase inhibitor gamma isoform X1 [Polypterus senegalus]|uniref:cAMP-dependent protein kinase inhibitor gamma isoform X1 n=2 Tax=Polypterus senegalus TaxID=55291 RepID=UPI0019642B75|nr:cAMP-dependent protein kinase inhibitor gamma isoform X1 [Polypterus senegalus]
MVLAVGYEVFWTEQTMEVEPAYLDFITCDRTGRRNAVTDIEGESSTLATSDLTKDLAQMDLKTQGEQVPDTSTGSHLENPAGSNPS